MTAFLLTAVAFTILWVFWQMLHFIFDLIDQHARAPRGGRDPDRERGSSGSR